MSAFIVIWLICGAIGAGIGSRKGRPWMGLALGILLGILGIIVMLFVPADKEHLIRQEQTRIEAAAEAQRRAGHPLV
jgi:hypothetical protein